MQLIIAVTIFKIYYYYSKILMEAKQKKLNSSHGPYIVKLESMNALQKHLFMKKYSNSYILQKIVYFLKKKSE